MIYSTAAVYMTARRPHSCEEKILGLKKRVEAHELHWDEVYDKVRRSLQALRMREGRERKKEENSRHPTFLSPESADPPSGSPTPSETPPPTREDLRDEIRESLL